MMIGESKAIRQSTKLAGATCFATETLAQWTPPSVAHLGAWVAVVARQQALIVSVRSGG